MFQGSCIAWAMIHYLSLLYGTCDSSFTKSEISKTDAYRWNNPNQLKVFTFRKLLVEHRISGWKEHRPWRPPVKGFEGLDYVALVRIISQFAEGKRLHSHISHSGYRRSTLLNNLLIEMYGKFGALDGAYEVFCTTKRNVFSWNIMLGACIRCDILDCAKTLFNDMPKRDIISWNAMLAAFAQSGNLEESKALFKKIPFRDLISWNTMLAAYVGSGHCFEALECFEKMLLEYVIPDKYSYSTVLNACAGLALDALTAGMRIHACIVLHGLDTDVTIGNALINMYGKCGSVESSRRAFDSMRQHDAISWTTMLSASAQSGYVNEVFQLLQKMIDAGILLDEFSYVTILNNACCNAENVTRGRSLHESIISRKLDSCIILGNALVNFYGKCGSLEDAQRVFDKMPEHDIASWNAILVAHSKLASLEDACTLFFKMPEHNVISCNVLIATYTENGSGNEAIHLFWKMQLEGIVPDKITYLVVLGACGDLVDVVEGEIIHDQISRSAYSSDIAIGSSLIDMYGKCGSVDAARLVFETMPWHNVVSWSSILAAYSQNGLEHEALSLFQQMQAHHVLPNGVSLLSILAACSHAGLVDEAYHSFLSIYQIHNILPTLEHQQCLVDLLGRTGSLYEAAAFIESMVSNYVLSAWTLLLNYCRSSRNIKLTSDIEGFLAKPY